MSGHPQSIGRYEIIDVIGQGAMGIVYKARDPNIDRVVAIKTIKFGELEDSAEAEEMLARFKREIQTAGVLAHANIVTIYDGGHDGDVHWIAMEYVDGPSLDKLTGEKVIISTKDLLTIFVKICSAIDFAHKHGIIHRDLKPANILLTQDWEPKVADFGIARVASSTMTRTGVILGTPSYMSPEQITGQKIDTRSDIFSLGIILYEMLAGERPFLGDNPTTIMYRIVHSEPVKPCAINLTLPNSLSDVVLKALGKNPSQRYATASEMARELISVVKTEPELSLSTSRLDMPTAALDSDDLSRGFDDYKRVPSPGRIAGSTGFERKRRHTFLITFVVLVAVVASIATVLYILSQRGGSGAAGSGGLSSSQTGNSGTKIVPTPDMTKKIVLTSEPESGARIFVDGEEVGGETPTTIELTRPAGSSIEVRLVKGCMEARETIQFNDAEPLTRPFTLAPMRRQVRVVSNPEGARIRVDGEDKGSTPGLIEVECGRESELSLSASGYRKLNETINWASVRGREELAFELERVEPGFVVINSQYRADVMDKSTGRTLVRGEGFQPAGAGSFSVRIPATPGRRTLRIVNPRIFLDVEVSVDVAEGGTAEVGRELPLLGRLSVYAQPANCNVKVNGVEVTNRMPLRNQPVVAGSYRIEFDWGGGRTKVETVDLGSGQVKTVAGKPDRTP